MTRSECIRKIMDDVGSTDIVISSTGYISRAVFEYRDRPLNFYMMGSMGNALGIGIGLAFHVKNKVIVISGDGAVLMGLGSVATMQKYNLPNLFHVVINNSCHETTGGQPTAFNYLSIKEFNNTIVYKIDRDLHIPQRIKLSPEEITERFKNAITFCNK